MGLGGYDGILSGQMREGSWKKPRPEEGTKGAGKGAIRQREQHG